VDYVIRQVMDRYPTSSVGTLYLPPGRYLIDKPIKVAMASQGRYAYCSIRITGDAPSYGSRSFHGSALLTSYANLPAIIIQAGRAVRIENLALEGKNNWTLSRDSGHIEVLYDDANFLVPGVTDGSRYAPYAGICIDPFCAAPKDPPPGGLYPGLEAEYLPSSGSSLVSIVDCFIYGFVVGIAISPNGFSADATQNAENIAIDNCTIASTKSAIAVCQDQSRAVSCRNLSVGGTKYAIDCTHYGKGSGCCPSLFNANITLTKYIFSTFSWGAGAAFDGVICESTLSVGFLGGGGTSDGYSFNGCTFKLMYAADRPSIGFHLVNTARATFNACQFALQTPGRAEAAPLWIYSAGLTSFHDCLMGGTNYPDNSPSFWVLGAPERMTFDNTTVVYSPVGALFSQTLQLRFFLNLLNQAVLPGCLISQLWDPNPGGSPRWVASGLRYIALGTAGAIKLTLHPATGTATFHPTAPGVVAPGDLVSLGKSYTKVIDAAPNAPVQPVLGKVISIDDQTGIVTLGHVPEYVVADPANAPDPTAALAVVGFYKIHCATTAQAVSGDPRKLTLPTPLDRRAWIVGDRVRAREGFIPKDTHVSAVETTGTPATLQALVLSQPLSGTPTGPLTLYDADVRTFTSTQVY
jgi:hypothetical protein